MAGTGPAARDGAMAHAAGLDGMQGALSLSIGASPAAVRDALDRVAATLRRSGIAGEDAANVELVLAEALNNIVEHAFPEPSAEAWIELTVVPGQAGIGCELRDNGRPMPNGVLPRTTLPGLPSPSRPDRLETLPEGGFGWYMIRTLARDLCYAHELGTNRLVLRIPYARVR